MKQFSKVVFIFYLLVLLWLILFKFSYDIPAVLDHHARVINLNPFAVFFQGSLSEALENLIVFIPFGLLLSVCFKQVTIWQSLSIIFAASLTAEILQFTLAIGTTDITDVITNTAGGLFGLVAYKLGARYTNGARQDKVITITTALLLLAILYLRIFVFRVRY